MQKETKNLCCKLQNKKCSNQTNLGLLHFWFYRCEVAFSFSRIEKTGKKKKVSVFTYWQADVRHDILCYWRFEIFSIFSCLIPLNPQLLAWHIIMYWSTFGRQIVFIFILNNVPYLQSPSHLIWLLLDCRRGVGRTNGSYFYLRRSRQVIEWWELLLLLGGDYFEVMTLKVDIRSRSTQGQLNPFALPLISHP